MPNALLSGRETLYVTITEFSIQVDDKRQFVAIIKGSGLNYSGALLLS